MADFRLNGLSVTFAAADDDRITATVPAGAGIGPISIGAAAASAGSAAGLAVAHADGPPDFLEPPCFGMTTTGNAGDGHR